MNSPFSYREYKITNKTEVAPDTFLFRLRGKLKFDPGQFVQVKFPHIGEVTLVPCSKKDEKTYFELCVRRAGNTTEKISEKVPGDSMFVRGPYGHGWPIGKTLEKDILLISGGIGIIPLMPLMDELVKYRGNFGKIYFLAGFKTPHHVMFEQDLLRYKKKISYFKVAVEKTDRDWWGENCMITDLIKNTNLSPNINVFLCGPEIMFRPCVDVLLQKKINPKNIYVSFERRMECGIGFCQHCTIGKYKVCEDGPIFTWSKIAPELEK
ncbi:MAG: FAD/NAD(P)-binding protein [Patescibacteria group bacterium]